MNGWKMDSKDCLFGKSSSGEVMPWDQETQMVKVNFPHDPPVNLLYTEGTTVLGVWRSGGCLCVIDEAQTYVLGLYTVHPRPMYILYKYILSLSLPPSLQLLPPPCSLILFPPTPPTVYTLSLRPPLLPLFLRRSIKTEEKANVVAAAWGTELIQFLATLAIFHHDDMKNRMNCTRIG